MLSFTKKAGGPFRITASMAALLCGIEAAGFVAASVDFKCSEFFFSLVTGLAAAGLFSMALAAVSIYIKQLDQRLARISSVAGSLAVLYLVLVLWMRQAFFGPEEPRWFTLIGFWGLMGLLIGLGRMMWFYLSRVYSDLVTARFQALAPVSVVCAGCYSVANAAIASRAHLAMAVLAILVMFFAGQYLTIRFIWGRKRERLDKWGARLHLMVMALVFLAAGIAALAERTNERRPASAPADSPSVILISIDTLRADFLSVNNPKAAPTPVMDMIANDGINFLNARAPSSWTVPSVASIITGLYPSAAGAGLALAENKPIDYTGPLPQTLTLARAFSEAGYVTAGFVDNSWLSKSRGYDSGFAVFELAGDIDLNPRFLVSRGWELLYRPFHHFPSAPATRITNRALEWLARRPDGPFFLWLHYIDPHTPYDPHDRYPAGTRPGELGGPLAKNRFVMSRHQVYAAGPLDKLFVREMYQGEVRFNDDEVGRVIDALKKEGIYDGGVVCLTSDHGEELWEHGWFTHGHTYNREVINVPLSIKLPGNRRAGSVVDLAVNNHRLGATLLEAAGIRSGFGGKSLLACLEDPLCGDPSLKGRFWMSERSLFWDQVGAVGDIEGRYKAIFFVGDAVECYDLANDPGEKNPIGLDRCPWPEGDPGPVEIFKLFKEDNRRTFLSLGGLEAKRRRATGEELRRLKDLGYVQ